ncbi:MAG: tRNA guanosine(34) transglycosylase Tgt [Thermoanaerobaculia bacterium]|jgi:queuine tRNA-ribosyltransferase
MEFAFEVFASDGKARRARLTLPHGVVETPAFMPVGTLGAVKGLSPSDLEAAGASIMLSNLYHLSLRPGIEVIETLGGLHEFTGWQRPMLTDSGGYQVFSLANLRHVGVDGVTFRSHLDGAELRLTPESVVQAQRRIGVDIAMVLDECPPWPVTREVAAASLDRTHQWAIRSRQAWQGTGMALFGILQGSIFPELRQRAAEQLSELDFGGYAIGGVSVGEPTRERRAVIELTAPLLPTGKPRYLMGVGTPRDIVHAVQQGVDLFDCVLPSRNARHGMLFTRQGLVRIKNARYREDSRPVDPDCSCPICRRVSRALLHHLIRSGELTGAVLATQHNVRYYLDFVMHLREAIASGTLSRVAASVAACYPEDSSFSESPATPDSTASIS